MATVNSNFQPVTGRSFVNLTSWAGDASFPTTPAAGSQIEFVSTLSVGVNGVVTGSNGSYTLVHITSAGTAQAMPYTISAGAVPQGTVTISSITVTSTTATVTFSYNDTDQTGFEYRIDGGSWASATSPQVVTGLSADTGYSVDVRAINATGGGTPASDTFTTSALAGPTINASFIAGANYTTTTLGATPSQDNFGLFAVAPVENDQITTLTADGTFDTGGNFSQTTGGNYTVYHTRYVTGVIAAETVSVGDVTVSDSTPSPGDTFVATFGGKVGPFTATYKGQSLTIASQNTTSITITWPALQTLGDQSADYNTAYDLVITDTDDSSEMTVSITTAPAAGYDYHTATGHPWPDTSIYYNDPSMANGFKHYGHFTQGSGTVATDGTITNITDRSEYEYWIYDGANWGNSATEIFHILGPFLDTPLELVAGSETISSLQLRFQADVSGNYRIVGVPQTNPIPTIAQRLAGLNSSGAPAAGDSGLTAFSADTLTTDTMTGLPSGSGLAFYIGLEDALGRTSGGGPVNGTTLSVGTPPSWVANVPNQSWDDGEIVSLDFKPYASGYTSFAITGLAVGTGLTLNSSTGVLSGAVNLNDASGADGTTVVRPITIQAINSTGVADFEFEASFYNRDLPTITAAIPEQSWSETFAVPLNVSGYIAKETSYELQIDNGSGYVSATATIATYNITFDTATGAFGGTPNSTATAASPLLFRVRGVNADGNGAWDEFQATVSAAAPPQLIGPIPSVFLTEGVPFSIDVSIYFTGALNYAITGQPVGSGLSINSSGVFQGAPSSADAAITPFIVNVIASNNDGTAQGTIGISIDPIVTPVLTTAFPDLALTIGDSLNIAFADYFTGADSYSISGRPAGSGITVSATAIGGTFSTSDSDAAPLFITVTATNSDGTTEDSFRIDSLSAPSTTTPISDPVTHVSKFYGDPYRTRTDYDGANWTRLKLYNEGVAFTLENITKATISLTDTTTGTEYTADSSTQGELFNLLVGSGKLDVRLGKVGAPAGTYYLEVYYFDVIHLDGVRFTAYRNIIVDII